MREIYLDNAATTKPLPEVIRAVAHAMEVPYGNPSSLHKKGIEAENIIKSSSEFFAKVLGVTTDEIIYTSGGTESNNLAILGTAYAYHRTGKKIITTAIEHPSVGLVFTQLESEGYEVIRLAVDSTGAISLEELENAIDEETILVSIMHVNNEIGTIQDIESIGKLIKKKNPKTIFHVDAIQSFGKMQIAVKKSEVDLLSISSHKFYGPNGMGLLYKNKNVRLINLLHGGGQQKNMRSGTQNVAGIAGMHVAAAFMYDKLQEKVAHLMTLKSYLYEQITATIEGVMLHGPAILDGAPHILNLGFKDVRAEVLLHALEKHNIFVSSGSACSSNKVTTSSTLQAISDKCNPIDDAIRFSFSADQTVEQMDEVVEVLKQQIIILRKYTVGGKKR